MNVEPGPEVFELVKAGNHPAFGTLVRYYQGYAFALAMRFVWDRTEAEDVVQEVFMRVWRNVDTYDPAQKFTTWLYAIVARLSIDRIRSRQRWRRVILPGGIFEEKAEPFVATSPEDRLDNEQLAETVVRLVRHLPQKQRLVFTLRDLQDLTMEEVAEVAGMSPAAVKANLCYARQRIRKMLGVTKRP